MEGFLVFDFLKEYESARKVKQLIKDKKILPENDVFDGLDRSVSVC